MREAIKNVVFWNYGRTTWQYDVLCLLILAFIFLTPPGWFNNGKEREPLVTPKISKMFVSTNQYSPYADENTRLRQIRELTGNNETQIVGWRERRDHNGNVTGYEVDVR